MTDEVEVEGLSFSIPPGVAPVTDGSRLMASVLEVRAGEHVLDLGTGCGVQAVLAAKRGATVVATDVVPACLDCARANAQRHGVADRVEFRLGNLLEPVAGERFDVIIAIPPQMPASDKGAPSATDEAGKQGRAVLDVILHQAHQYLRAGGRLLLCQFAFHSVERSLAMLSAQGLEASVIAEQSARSRQGEARLELLQSLGMTEGVELRAGAAWFRRVVIYARAAIAMVA